MKVRVPATPQAPFLGTYPEQLFMPSVTLACDKIVVSHHLTSANLTL